MLQEPNGVPDAISHEMLMKKAGGYITKALRDKDHQDFTAYQFWASLCLELLGKAVLASIHPSLIIAGKKREDFLAACGLKPDYEDVRTITAEESYLRLYQIQDKFDSKIRNYCEEICARRNRELHSGSSPFEPMNLADWEGGFWKAVEAMLAVKHMPVDLWLATLKEGRERAIESFQISSARDELAKENYRDHIEAFLKLSDAEKRKKRDAADLISRRDRDCNMMSRAPYGNSEVDQVVCPCCGYIADACGSKVGSETVDEEFVAGEFWEEVEHTYRIDVMFCPCCELSVNDVEVMMQLDLPTTFYLRSRQPKASNDEVEEVEIRGELHEGFSIREFSPYSG